jgi:hypothetical protein
VAASRSDYRAAKFATDRGIRAAGYVAEIDLRRLTPDHPYVDVSSPARAAVHVRDPLARLTAVDEQEVAIYGGVNPEAIVAIRAVTWP